MFKWFEYKQLGLFWFASLQSLIGDEIGYIALMSIAYSHWRSALAVSGVLLADLAAMVLLGNLFGRLADIFRRRILLVMADVFRAVAFLGIFVFGGSYYAILIFAALAGIGSALAQPALLSGLPNLAAVKRRDSLITAHATLQAVIRTAGPFLAAAVLVIVSAKIALLINAASFIVSAVIVATLTQIDRQYVRSAAPWKDVVFQNLWRMPKPQQMQPALRGLIVLGGLGALAGGFLTIGEVILAFGHFHNGSAGLGLLVGAYGVGMAAGTYLARAVNKARLLAGYSIALILFGASMIGMGFATNQAALLLAFFSAGIANGLTISFGRLYIHQTIDPHQTGEAFGKKAAVDSSALLVSMLLAGILAHSLSIKSVFLWVGLLLVACSGWILIKVSAKVESV